MSPSSTGKTTIQKTEAIMAGPSTWITDPPSSAVIPGVTRGAAMVVASVRVTERARLPPAR